MNATHENSGGRYEQSPARAPRHKLGLPPEEKLQVGAGQPGADAVSAGREGVVDFVYDSGRGLHVEVARKDGSTAGFVQMEIREGEAGEVWRVVAYSQFGS